MAIFIPPPGVKARLVGMKTKMVVTPRNSDEGKLTLANPDYNADGNWWYVDRSPDGEGYTLRSTSSKRYMGAFKAQQLMVGSVPDGLWNSETYSAANVFTIEAGTGLRMSQFRLYFKETGKAMSAFNFESKLIAASGSDVYLDASNSESDEQYFAFVLEDMEFTSIEYKLPHGKLISSTPKHLTSQTATNHTSDTQKRSVTLTMTVEESSHWDNELGFMVGAEVKGKAGVPLLAEGEITVKAEVHYNRSWGKTAGSSRSWSDTVELTIGPKKSYKVTASAIDAVLEVPYVATWVSKASGISMPVHGTYKGVTTYDFTTTFFEIPYDPQAPSSSKG